MPEDQRESTKDKKTYCFREIKQDDLPEYCKIPDDLEETFQEPKFLEVGLIAITEMLSSSAGADYHKDFDLQPDDSEDIKMKKIKTRRKCILFFHYEKYSNIEHPYDGKELREFMDETKEYYSDSEEKIITFQKQTKKYPEFDYDEHKKEFKGLLNELSMYHKLDEPTIQFTKIPYDTDHDSVQLYYKGYCCQCNAHFDNSIWGD
jgi:hypothetical protein